MNSIVPCVLNCLDCVLEVIPTSARHYVACPPSSRHLEESVADRTIAIDHSMMRRWKITRWSIHKLLFEFDSLFSDTKLKLAYT
jgi:hypothetical protein